MITVALLVNLLVLVTFFLVPRGVVVGTPVFQPRAFSHNSTAEDYTLKLGVELPIYNANYYRVRRCQPWPARPAKQVLDVSRGQRAISCAEALQQ